MMTTEVLTEFPGWASVGNIVVLAFSAISVLNIGPYVALK
jgi:hypothetical protein